MQCYKFMLLWQQNRHTVLDLPKTHYFQKLYLYIVRERERERDEKKIVRDNNLFKLWMINTWVTHIKIFFFKLTLPWQHT